MSKSSRIQISIIAALWIVGVGLTGTIAGPETSVITGALTWPGVAMTVFLSALAAGAWNLTQRQRHNERLTQICHAWNEGDIDPGDLDGLDSAPFTDALRQFAERAQAQQTALEAHEVRALTEEKFASYRAARYEAILQAIPDGVLILDEDFKVIFANQHIENTFGIAGPEGAAVSIDGWCTNQKLLQYLGKIRREGRFGSDENYLMDDPKATGRTLGFSTHPLFLNPTSASNSGLLILMRDMSLEIAANQSRAEFVGSVSHEVKAPLNTIGLYAQLLEDQADDAEFIVEAHNTITQEVERMTRLINNLLSMTQIEMGTFELDEQRSHLKDIVEDCVQMLGHGADESRIHIVGGDKLPPVVVDKELIRIAISNLLTNALKYSADAQPVTLEMEETAEAILVHVSDEGLGIAEADQEHIFDKFFRSANEAANAEAGHGLGLAIAKEIMQLHHGSISLESALGEGSRFTLEFWKNTGITKQAI